MKKILLFLTLFATPSLATERMIMNPESNGDLVLKANVGGTPTTALTVLGTSGAVAFQGQSNIRSTEGAGVTTLTVNDKRTQIFNLSAGRDVKLPTTGVKAGEVFTIANRANFVLSVQASNGSDISVANSSNMNCNIAIGQCTVLALADTPTTPSDWYVLNVAEKASVSGISVSGALTTTVTVLLARSNHQVTARLGASGTCVTNVQLSFVNAIPARMRPASSNTTQMSVQILNNGANATEWGRAELSNSTGTISVRRTGDSNFTNSATCGLGFNATTDPATMTFDII